MRCSTYLFICPRWSKPLATVRKRFPDSLFSDCAGSLSIPQPRLRGTRGARTIFFVSYRNLLFFQEQDTSPVFRGVAPRCARAGPGNIEISGWRDTTDKQLLPTGRCRGMAPRAGEGDRPTAVTGAIEAQQRQGNRWQERDMKQPVEAGAHQVARADNQTSTSSIAPYAMHSHASNWPTSMGGRSRIYSGVANKVQGGTTALAVAGERTDTMKPPRIWLRGSTRREIVCETPRCLTPLPCQGRLGARAEASPA